MNSPSPEDRAIKSLLAIAEFKRDKKSSHAIRTFHLQVIVSCIREAVEGEREACRSIAIEKRDIFQYEGLLAQAQAAFEVADAISSRSENP